MPLIQVDAPQDTLNKNEQDALISQLSNAVLKAERAPIDSAGAQSLVWAFYDEKPKTAIYVGSENLQEPPFRIAVTTPQGALTHSSRESLVLKRFFLIGLSSSDAISFSGFSKSKLEFLQ